MQARQDEERPGSQQGQVGSISGLCGCWRTYLEITDNAELSSTGGIVLSSEPPAEVGAVSEKIGKKGFSTLPPAVS